MFYYFSFISHVRAALFFNVLKTLKQLWDAETICFRVLFQFYFMLCELLKWPWQRVWSLNYGDDEIVYCFSDIWVYRPVIIRLPGSYPAFSIALMWRVRTVPLFRDWMWCSVAATCANSDAHIALRTNPTSQLSGRPRQHMARADVRKPWQCTICGVDCHWRAFRGDGDTHSSMLVFTARRSGGDPDRVVKLANI